MYKNRTSDVNFKKFSMLKCTRQEVIKMYLVFVDISKMNDILPVQTVLFEFQTV